MNTELTTGSWSSLANQERATLFSRLMIRVDQVLSTHMVTHLLPEELDTYLPGAIQWMEAKLEPAGEEVARQAIDYACSILRCKKPGDAELKGYVSLMKTYPRELLLESIGKALEIETHHVLPTPGALLRHARERFLERSEKMMRAKHALTRLEISRRWKRA